MLDRTYMLCCALLNLLVQPVHLLDLFLALQLILANKLQGPLLVAHKLVISRALKQSVPGIGCS